MHGSTTNSLIIPAVNCQNLPGHFGRMLPHLSARPDFMEAESQKISELMTDPPENEGRQDPAGDNLNLEAGFTFLGQFIDHDITRDNISRLDSSIDPRSIENVRTSTLELDSVYGDGPLSTVSQHLYEEDLNKFPLGTLRPGDPDSHDLARAEDGGAFINDDRNDENMIISQLHLLFIKFHNKILAQLIDRTLIQRFPEDLQDLFAIPISEAPSGINAFTMAQKIVRWHYQWIVLNEYLRKTIGDDLVDDVLNPLAGRKWYLPDERAFGAPYMPVEFSVAAFRFGHSQIRGAYLIRAGVPLPLFDLSEGNFGPVQPGQERNRRDLRGGLVAPEHAIDWRFFFDIDPQVQPTPGRKIDEKLSVPALNQLPDNATGDTAGLAVNHLQRSLAFRNLRRSQSFSLPSGEEVAKAFGEPILTERQLGLRQKLDPDAVETPFRASPLWYYILRESKVRFNGERLGPVGGRILAEVFIGMLQIDKRSYLSQNPNWKPFLAGPREQAAINGGGRPGFTRPNKFNIFRRWIRTSSAREEARGDFTMRDLIKYVGP